MVMGNTIEINFLKTQLNIIPITKAITVLGSMLAFLLKESI